MSCFPGLVGPRRRPETLLAAGSTPSCADLCELSPVALSFPVCEMDATMVPPSRSCHGDPGSDRCDGASLRPPCSPGADPAGSPGLEKARVASVLFRWAPGPALRVPGCSCWRPLHWRLRPEPLHLRCALGRGAASFLCRGSRVDVAPGRGAPESSEPRPAAVHTCLPRLPAPPHPSLAVWCNSRQAWHPGRGGWPVCLPAGSPGGCYVGGWPDCPTACALPSPPWGRACLRTFTRCKRASRSLVPSVRSLSPTYLMGAVHRQPGGERGGSVGGAPSEAVQTSAPPPSAGYLCVGHAHERGAGAGRAL